MRNRVCQRGPKSAGFIRRKVVICLQALTFVALSVGAFSVSAQTADVCNRTPQVREAILDNHGIEPFAYWSALFNDWTRIRLRQNSRWRQRCEDVTIEDLSEIKSLSLSRLGISSLRENDFAEMSNLRMLRLDRNQLSTLPETVFSDLHKLEELVLLGNHLSTLPETVFSELGNLKKLSLSNNELNTLPATVFSGLDSLEELILPDNGLSTLPATLFENLNRLKFLSLRNNGIETLPATVFAGLNDLLILRLHQNELSALPAGVFAGLSVLQELYLYGNQLDALPSAVFASLGSLEELNLSGNRLDALPDGVFVGLHSLRSLSLHNNLGAPFNLKVEFEQLNEPNSAASFARFRLIMRKGAPGEVTVPLAARESIVFPDHAVFSAGDIRSNIITVSRRPASPTALIAPTVLREACPTSSPPCYEGFRITAESPPTLEAIPPSGLSFADTLVEAEEGGTAEIVLHWPQQYSSAITVEYSVGRDNNPHTDDADEQDYIVDGGVGSVTIAPGATTAAIRIPIIDDEDAEPMEEWFTVSLTAPDAGAGYVLGSLTTAAVVIKENVCDRTQQVQDELFWKDGGKTCMDVTSQDLRGITGLWLNFSDSIDILERPGPIQTLKENDFVGLSNLERLGLSDNQLATLPRRVFAGLGNLEHLNLIGNSLTTLPDGIFEGLHSLRMLWLHRNPGTFFDLGVGFEPIGTPSAASTFTEVRFTLREGAPGYIAIPLTVNGGTLSRDQVSLLTGSTQSEVVTVTRLQNIWSTVTVTPNPSPPTQTCHQGYYPCYRGFRIVADNLPVLEANPSTLSLASAQLEVEEGGIAVITVNSTLPQLSTFTVNYRIGKDSDKYTADAGGGDYSTDIATIAPGANSGVIRIQITDDGDIEPTSETFTVSLIAPSADEIYFLGSSITATVVIREGVCDRTSQVKDVIVDTLINASVLSEGDDCADVTNVDLANLKEGLNLRGRGIAALKQGDLSGLVNLKILRLNRNRLTTLMPGVFSGLGSLQELHLDSNQLTDLESGVFSGIGNLEILYLFNNDLSGELNAHVFSDLGSLRKLYLQSNALTGLVPKAFLSLGNLEILDLSMNYLAELPTDVFADLQNLQDLHLDFNDLGELPKRMFSGLLNLAKLSLNNNFDLDRNSGSPFRLTLQFDHVQSSSSDSNSAKVRLIMDEGSPFEITADLAVERGTLSSTEAILPRGSTASDTFDLYQSGSLPVIVSMSGEFASTCVVCYLGLEVVVGDPFTFDKKGPAVSGVEFVSMPSQGDSYLVSRDKRPSLRLAVSFDEAVIVSVSTGSPVLAVRVGETTRMASYDPDSSSTDRLVFHYPLTMDDFDNDGVSIAEDALRPNGATLRDAAGNEAKLDLTSNAIPNAAAHKVYRQSELSLATTRVEIVEGTTALLTVSATPPPHVNLNVGYHLSGEGDNKDYIGSSVRSIFISAFASTGTIEISTKDDTVIEPPRELLTVTLSPPSPLTAYFLAFPSTATVVIKEGICDRTLSVRDVFREHCSDVSEADLSGYDTHLTLGFRRGVTSFGIGDFWGFSNVPSLTLNGIELMKLPGEVFSGLESLRVLNLSSNELTALPGTVFSGLQSLQELNLRNNDLTVLPGTIFSGLQSLQELNLSRNGLTVLPGTVFSGLDQLQELELDLNDLESLPSGLFAGLTNLTKVWLQDNPGAPFTLTLRFERVKPAGEPAPDVFPTRLVVVEGAPFEITGDLSLENAVSPSTHVVVPTGSTASEVFTVTRVNADFPVVVDLENLSQVPNDECGSDLCYQGIRIGVPKPFDPSRRVVDLSVPQLVSVGPDGSTMFTVTTVPVLTGREQVTVRFTIHSAFRLGFILPDGSTSKTTEFSLSEDVPFASVSVEVLVGLEGEADVTAEVSSTQNVVVNSPKKKFKLFSIPRAPSDGGTAGQGGYAPPLTMRQYAAPLPDSSPLISVSLVFSPSTRVQVEQGRSTTFGVSVSPALVLGEALSLRLAIREDENQSASGVTFAGSSSVRLTFDGSSPAREYQVPVSATATAVIGTTAPVFADEVAALGISFAGKSPLQELSVTTPRVAVSFTPEALPPLEVGSSATVSLSLRDYELQSGQQAKLRVQMFGVGWSVYPATVTLTAETPVVGVSLRASDEATFGVLRVTALEGVELLREAVLEVQVGQ